MYIGIIILKTQVVTMKVSVKSVGIFLHLICKVCYNNQKDMVTDN